MRWLVAVFALVLSLEPAWAGETIDPNVAQVRRQAGNTTLIDVRTAEEWADTGLPEGAKAITFQDPAFVQKVLDSVGGDKSKPVTLICRSGNRSATAMALLEKQGFGHVDHVGGGIKKWMADGLPVVK